ncbi:hypothetical protein CK203_033990 [Vitis vinifera]|uniref:Reverse transcriptase domain-containing protein n=1 Tax=Vitis vinifera TaxID=29760 RepID=A0A438IB91_VITVI|nr:hypothetical protein CK203_033990 [Vitis vinifera]
MLVGVVRTLGSGRFLDWGAMGAQGFAGGILICWDKRSLEMLKMEVGQFSISCRLRNVEDGLVWIFTRVYGPFTRNEMETLWDELRPIRGIWDDPWCLGSDFNVTLFQRERSSQDSLNGAMRRFAQVVDELELLYLPLQGVVFSWSGDRNNQSWARLDCFLGGGLRRGPSPFRFENMWLKVDGFKDLIRDWWLEINKSSALQQVEFWDGVECERGPPEGETELKNEAKETFKKWLSEEPGWRADIEGLHLQRLNHGEVEALEMPFTEEEIHLTLLEMNGRMGLLWPFGNLKHKEKGLVCKLDIEKAYDSINWNFLMKVLHKMGFGSRWMEWIWWCISTAKFSIIVNRVPVGFFSSSKGLCQVDPISPYLFVLGMEVLSALIRKAIDGGFISGCKLRGKWGMEMNVSHLLFVDDTIIFYEARKEHLTHLGWILGGLRQLLVLGLI